MTGDSVVSFSLATSESWRDKASGERKERTEWHNVVIFNENLGKIAEQYCKKGAKVYLEGQLQTREFTDRDGNQRKTTEVVLQRFRGELTLLDGRGRGDVSAAKIMSAPGVGFGRSSPMERTQDQRPAAGGGRIADMIDDDIILVLDIWPPIIVTTEPLPAHEARGADRRSSRSRAGTIHVCASSAKGAARQTSPVISRPSRSGAWICEDCQSSAELFALGLVLVSVWPILTIKDRRPPAPTCDPSRFPMKCGEAISITR